MVLPPLKFFSLSYILSFCRFMSTVVRMSQTLFNRKKVLYFQYFPLLSTCFVRIVYNFFHIFLWITLLPQAPYFSIYSTIFPICQEEVIHSFFDKFSYLFALSITLILPDGSNPNFSLIPSHIACAICSW